jgi:uncharacterized membrane protein
MKRVSKYFFSGLVIIVPITITIIVVMTIFNWTEGLLGHRLPVHIPGLGLLMVLIVIPLVGWMSSIWILQRMLAHMEKLVNSIPFVKFIYNSVKQVSTAVFDSQSLFRQAVLVPYPHPGCKALGFVVPELSAPIANALGEEHVCVFIPMSLNITAGLNIIVPKRDIIPLDVTSESALQYILTAGTIMPRGNE